MGSTFGGVFKIVEHFWAHWSATQAAISLSSTEGEADAMTKRCVEGVYAKVVLAGVYGHHEGTCNLAKKVRTRHVRMPKEPKRMIKETNF